MHLSVDKKVMPCNEFTRKIQINIKLSKLSTIFVDQILVSYENILGIHFNIDDIWLFGGREDI